MTFDLQALQPFFLVIAGFGLWLSLCMEQSQIVAKTRGAFAGNIATGYMSAMRIMIVNHAGTIVYVFFLSLCIDTGITNRILLIVSIFSSVFMIIYNLFLILNSAKLLEYSADLQRENFMHFLFERDNGTSCTHLPVFCYVVQRSGSEIAISA